MTDPSESANRGRSNTPSPIVLVAIAAGVLLVVAAVLITLLLRSDHSDQTPSAASPTSASFAATGEILTTTMGVEAPGGHPTGSDTTSAPPDTAPDIAGADRLGFTNGPRCNADDPAIVIGETEFTQLVICQVGNADGAALYYKGISPGGVAFETDSVPPHGDGVYDAVTDDSSYSLTTEGLLIASDGLRYPLHEWRQYWYR